MITLLAALLCAPAGETISVAEAATIIAETQKRTPTVASPIQDIPIWISSNTNPVQIEQVLPNLLDGKWEKPGGQLKFVLDAEKWRQHRNHEHQGLIADIRKRLPKAVPEEIRRQFFEDSLLPAEAMRLTREQRAVVTESYHSPLSFWHSEVLVNQDAKLLASAVRDWETIVFSSSPTASERPYRQGDLSRILSEVKAFAEWIAGWQERVPNRHNLVTANLERFVDAAPNATAARHSLECRPGLIVSTIALYDQQGNLLHEDSRLIPISRAEKPKRDVAAPLPLDPVLLSLEQKKGIWNAGLSRWASIDATELLAGFGDPDSPIWHWRDLIGTSLERKFPDRPILLWLPDAELFRLAKFIKGEHFYVADYLRAGLADPGGLTLTISDEAVIVRPELPGEALDQVLPKDAVIAFAQAAQRHQGFGLEVELKLAAAGGGYLYSPTLRTIRRLAAFIPFIWPYAPADERVVWALSHIVTGNLDATKFPIQASAVPADARRALYAMQGRAGLTIISGQERAPMWNGAITSRWQNGIPGTALFTLTTVESPVIRQRLNHSPWSSPSEPKSIGFTTNQLIGRQFWPGFRTDRHLQISDGRGAQITFPIIDGFTFDEAKQGADYDALPTTHRPVLIDPP